MKAHAHTCFDEGGMFVGVTTFTSVNAYVSGWIAQVSKGRRGGFRVLSEPKRQGNSGNADEGQGNDQLPRFQLGMSLGSKLGLPIQNPADQIAHLSKAILCQEHFSCATASTTSAMNDDFLVF